MDKLEKRLKDDAGRIRAEVPPQLRARVAAAVRHTARKKPAEQARGAGPPLWLAGGLGGLAAAVLVIVLTGRGKVGPSPPDAAVAYSVPAYVQQFEHAIPLRARTADLTGPLEEELEKLRTDLEKARDNVERDLDFTF